MPLQLWVKEIVASVSEALPAATPTVGVLLAAGFSAEAPALPTICSALPGSAAASRQPVPLRARVHGAHAMRSAASVPPAALAHARETLLSRRRDLPVVAKGTAARAVAAPALAFSPAARALGRLAA